MFFGEFASFKRLLLLEDARWKDETIAEKDVANRAVFPLLHPERIEVENREPAANNNIRFRHKHNSRAQECFFFLRSRSLEETVWSIPFPTSIPRDFRYRTALPHISQPARKQGCKTEAETL